MAQGIAFDEANTVLRAPTPEDAVAGTVYDLHVHRYRDLDGKSNVLSKWQLTAEELAEVNRTGGTVWFSCWGVNHPPMWISGHDPFDRGAAVATPTSDPGASYVITADRDPATGASRLG